MKRKLIPILFCILLLLNGCGSGKFDEKRFDENVSVVSQLIEEFDSLHQVNPSIEYQSYTIYGNGVTSTSTSYELNYKAGEQHINISILNSTGELEYLTVTEIGESTDLLRVSFDFWVNKFNLNPNITYDQLEEEGYHEDDMFSYTITSGSLFIQNTGY